MPYIGKQPTVGNFQVCDAISVVNGQAAYTMQVGGSNVEPENANHMLVSLNGVLQKPGSSFTISGSTITFASNLATGDVIDFITLLGDTLNTGAPSDDTVTAAKINNDVISGQTELAATHADTDELLISDAGTIKRIDFSHLKTGITMADNFRVTSNFTGDANPISSNWERNDTAPALASFGSQMSESSGIFTFPSTGIYYVGYQAQFSLAGDSAYVNAIIQATTNNSSYSTSVDSSGHITQNSSATTYAFLHVTQLFDITDTSNQKVRFRIAVGNSGTTIHGSSTYDQTAVRFFRLGDT